MSDVLGEAITGEPESEEIEQLAEAIIEAIERPRLGDSDQLGYGPGGWLPAHDLPGFGEEGDDCGEPVPHYCSDCGHDFEIGRTCARSVCPRCSAAWVMKRAGTSREAGEDVPGLVAHLNKTAKMMSSRIDAPVFKHHAVFSPPPDSWFLECDDPLDRTFQVIKEIMAALGMEGVVFYHPWAGKNEEHNDPRAEGEGPGDRGDDRGKWKRRLFSGRQWEGDVREELTSGRPHFHVVGCAPFLVGGELTRIINGETGWIFKRITKNDSVRSLSNLEDVAAAVTYCLSHTGIDTTGEQNQACYRKYGSTYHSGHVTAEDREEGDRAVRSVAPTTLGISSRSVTCYNHVPEGVATQACKLTRFEESAGEGDVDGDGSGAGEIEADQEADVEEVHDSGAGESTKLVECRGKIVHIREAEHHLSDDEWRQRAPFAETLQSTFERWKDGPPDG